MVKVLVLGAGYASLAFIKALPKRLLKTCHFTLISQSSQHYFSVLLHEVLAGIKGQYTLELSAILPPEVEFIQDCVLEIQEGKVLGERASYAYDKLVVGLGFHSDSFKIPGVETHAHSLVNFAGAQATHQALLQAIKTFDQARPFSLVVCGGGFSGIELLGALSDTLPNLCGSKAFKLTCIEALPGVLPMFKAKLVQKGVAYLQHLGVELEVGAKILECQHDCVVVEQNHIKKEIKADFIIWTCGVRGNPVIEKSSLFKSVRSRVEVNSFLQPLGLENREIFVLGDCALFKDKTNRPYAPTAQLASQMGTYLGKQFIHIIAKQQPKQPFIFKPKGSICSIGMGYAIGSIGGVDLCGKLSLWLKKYIEWRWKCLLRSNS
ncbi:NAD(P)/FAD-dependent oxidoreductase [Helicobacter suis]|uniref:NAD(P)/FAD-dependent oxidoreductase n=1 Tax=Helicobacter suis TaxID=104628 RepID=UPI0002DD45F1|nr:NAD(P)/FAD-dependent oxidoreductase [Helicobacter suis]BDR27662.1 NADH dehydrogenase [Helicobacter suis HS1]